MSKRKKIALIVLAGIALLLIAAAVIIPALVNVDRYRPQVAAYISKETGKPARIAHIALTIFPRVAIRVDGFELGNPPGFPQGYLIRTKQIDAVVDASKLWNHQVMIESLILENPSIHLLSDVRGRWNFENPPARAAASSSSSPPMFSLGVISKVLIHHGDVTMANLLSSGRAGPAYFAVQDASSELDNVDLNAFTGSGTARLAPSDKLGPSGGWLTSMAFAAEPLGRQVAHGTLDADRLRFGELQASGVKSNLRLYPKQIFFDDVALKLYQGRAQGKLGFNFAGRETRYNVDAHCRGVNVAQLLAAFPQARGKMSGTMDGAMKLAGIISHSEDPLAGMKGTGQVSVRNGQLPSLQLNKNLMLLARLASLGPASGDPSSFSSITADLNIVHDRMASRNINIIGNGTAVNAAGSLALAGAGNLDYQGLAKVAAGQNAVTGILASFSGATMSNGQLSFPFALNGTLDNPHFILKAAANALGNILGARQGGTQQQNSPANLLQGLTGLFGKKKTAKPPQL